MEKTSSRLVWPVLILVLALVYLAWHELGWFSRQEQSEGNLYDYLFQESRRDDPGQAGLENELARIEHEKRYGKLDANELAQRHNHELALKMQLEAAKKPDRFVGYPGN